MALFIFLAVVPGRRWWDGLRPPDSRFQAGCTAPARADAMAGWKQGILLLVVMGSLRWEQQPLPSPRWPWAGRAGRAMADGSMAVHGGPRAHWWDPTVAAAPEAAQADRQQLRESCPDAGWRLPLWWGAGRAGQPLACRAVRGCGEVSVGRWLLHKLIVF